jgi:hypothetical protein
MEAGLGNAGGAVMPPTGLNPVDDDDDEFDDAATTATAASAAAASKRPRGRPKKTTTVSQAGTQVNVAAAQPFAAAQVPAAAQYPNFPLQQPMVDVPPIVLEHPHVGHVLDICGAFNPYLRQCLHDHGYTTVRAFKSMTKADFKNVVKQLNDGRPSPRFGQVQQKNIAALIYWVKDQFRRQNSS